MQVFIQQEYKPFPVPVNDDMLDSLGRLVDPEVPVIWPDSNDYAQSYEPEAFED